MKSRTTIATAALAGALAAPAGAQTHAHRLLHPTIGGETAVAQLRHAGHGVLVWRASRRPSVASAATRHRATL